MKRAHDAQTTPILRQLEDLVTGIPGWSPVDQLYTLFNLVFAAADLPGDIVEIGCWCGRSTTALALAAKRVGRTRVRCIDLFPRREDWTRNPDGSYSFGVRIGGRRYRAYGEQTVWPEPFQRDIAPLYARHRGIRELFQSTLNQRGLRSVVTAFRGTAALFARTAAGRRLRCKLAFIDGDHGYEAVCGDFRQVDRWLVPGGWVCFDDALSGYDGVDQAIQELVLDNPAYDRAQQMTRKLFVARKRSSRR